MTFAPRFSPSGDKIIMSLAERGVTDIHVMNLNSQEVTRLTNSTSIDTSPSFSPNGKKIIFNSDRGGSQQLYIMDNQMDQMLKEYPLEKEDMQLQSGLQKEI